MQKSRLQGPSTCRSVLKGPRFICNTLLGLDLNQGRPKAKLKLKTLNMEHFVQRQSGDSFCDQLRCPIFREKLIQSKRINFNRRLLLKNCFSGSQKRGPPFEPQFCAQKWRNHNLGEEQGKPKPSISARTHLCKSYGFGSHKGQAPFRNFHSPWRFFGRNAIFTVNWEKRGG